MAQKKTSIRRVLPLLLLLTLPLGGALLRSCSDMGCTDNQSSFPMAQIYDYTNPMHNISLDSISIIAIGNDSVLADSVSQVAQIRLPFNQQDSCTQYVISYNHYWNHDLSKNDTITFKYEVYPYFASIDCGAMYNFDIDTVIYTRNIIDSIAVVRPTISNKNVENFRLYYTPAKL